MLSLGIVPLLIYVGVDGKLFFLQNTRVHSRTPFSVFIEVTKRFQNNVVFQYAYKMFTKRS